MNNVIATRIDLVCNLVYVAPFSPERAQRILIGPQHLAPDSDELINDHNHASTKLLA